MVERLDRAGLAPRVDSSATPREEPLAPTGFLVRVGSAELDGPADAGQQIRAWGVNDMDLGTQPFDYNYVRDKNRQAPHNVLISADGMWQKADQIGYGGPALFAGWPFTNLEGLRQGAQALGFTVRFGPMSPRFAARWDWDPALLRYVRSQFGTLQNDAATGEAVAAANVIVQYADAYVADGNGHVLIDAVGVISVLFLYAPIVLAVAIYGVIINRRYGPSDVPLAQSG